MRIRSYLLILLLGSLLLTACSEKKESETHSEPEEKEEQVQQEEEEKQQDSANLQELIDELPEISMTAEEFVLAAPGSYSGQRYKELPPEVQQEVVELFKELPKLGDKPSEEEIELYWRKTLSLFHADYPDPVDALEQVNISSFGNPEMEDERFQFKEQLNVEIILDGSGSMGNVIDGKTMMDIAKDSIKDFAASLPEGANIALRIYGHKGTGSDKDKELSCSSNELIYEMQGYDANLLNEALAPIKPAGWTPLADAIEQAKSDLSQYDSKTNTNIVYLVSDGIETCNGDPVAKAKELADSDIQPIVNVIGFDLDAKGQQQLKEVAEAARGMYHNARNQAELQHELEKAKKIAEKWDQWKKDVTFKVEDNMYDQFLKNIPDFAIAWRAANSEEHQNMPQPLRTLRDEGHITKAAFQLLFEKIDKRFSLGLEHVDQLQKNLRALAEKDLENAKEEIHKIYESNVDTES